MSRRGKTYIVTGGCSGLGEAVVQLLHGEGANIGIFDKANGDHLASSRVLILTVDVTNEKEVKYAIDSVITRFKSLDGVINCAGIGGAVSTLSRHGPHPLSQFDRIIKVNLYGTFNVARLASAVMAKQKPDEHDSRGVIINIGSIASTEGQKGQVAYAASKGALHSMTLPMARDLAQYGIRVLTIAPGVFGTPLVKSMPISVKKSLLKDVIFPKRFGTPIEFASIIRTCIDNPFINATCIRLDAGMRMSNL